MAVIIVTMEVSSVSPKKNQDLTVCWLKYRKRNKHGPLGDEIFAPMQVRPHLIRARPSTTSQLKVKKKDTLLEIFDVAWCSSELNIFHFTGAFI